MSPKPGGNGHGDVLLFTQPPQRVVSLVPSMTETLFELGLGAAVVGVTDFRRPPEIRPTVGGTRKPVLDRILALSPDLVIANQEENARSAVEQRREAGLRLWLTFPRNTADAIQLLWRIGQPAAEWRRALALLRNSAPAVSTLSLGRAVLPTDMDLLVGLLPSLTGLSSNDRERIMTQGRVLDVEPGTKLMQSGETGDSASFILSGKAVAGITEGQGIYHSLSSMSAGDYFGEIAALTGGVRTADVVAEEATRLLQVPASILHMMMAQPAFSQMVLARMSERLARTSIREQQTGYVKIPHNS